MFYYIINDKLYRVYNDLLCGDCHEEVMNFGGVYTDCLDQICDVYYLAPTGFKKR